MSREVLVRSENDATAEEASTAWTQKFGAPHVKLKRGLPDPLDVGKRLGSGGVGEVWATTIGGVPVALKRIYATHLTEAIFAEVKIMRQMAEKRHHHIVQLIGSYEKRHTNISELGLLIWPVAICDLAALLHDVDIANSWYVHGAALGEKTSHDEEDVIYAVEALARFESGIGSSVIIKENKSAFRELHGNTLNRLRKNIGCIASAVAWLHNCQIRHKDLKPSQILVSTSGLWLSDFGWSKDVSEMTCSTTVGGKTTTPKYLAPERALNQPCGRPEDIFSLGCIFLEVGFQLFGVVPMLGANKGAPWFQPGWLFSNHIGDATHLAQNIMGGMESNFASSSVSLLMRLVVKMLDCNPARRPSIVEVVATLATYPQFNGNCCLSTAPRSLDTSIEVPSDNLKSRMLQLANRQPNSLIHSTSSSGIVCSTIDQRTYQLDIDYGSASGGEESLRGFSSRPTSGQKRSLTEASSDHQSESPLTKRLLTDLPGSNTCFVSTMHDLNSEDGFRQLPQPIDQCKDLEEKERIYFNSTDRLIYQLPPPTTEGQQLPSINELPYFEIGGSRFPSPNMAYTFTPVEAGTNYPYGTLDFHSHTGSSDPPGRWEPQQLDILPDKSGATATEAFVQLSPDPLDSNWQLPCSSLPRPSVQSITQCEAEKRPTSPPWGPSWAYPGYISNPVASLHDKAENQGIENQGLGAFYAPIVFESRPPSKDRPSFAPSAYTRERPWKEPEQVNHACVHCRRSHMTCDGEQPCTRCITQNIEHLCRYESPTGMKKAKSDTENSIAQTH
jgi:serine/threonine protein kinase